MAEIDEKNIDLNFGRRTFLSQSFAGLGALALNSLFGGATFGQTDKWKGMVNPLHHKPKARRVIFLYQAGGPSHLETFDWKPELKRLDGKPFPDSFTKGQQLAQLQNTELKTRGA